MNHSYPYMYHPYFDGNHDYSCCQLPYYVMACNQIPPCCQTTCQCVQQPLSQMKLPQELLADATVPSAEGFIGGLHDTTLTLEYLKTSNNPSLKISITESGSTSDFSIATIGDGYTIKENFANVSPGAIIKIDVISCTARLRWCEFICC